mgnify:CR=1 FL=1
MGACYDGEQDYELEQAIGSMLACVSVNYLRGYIGLRSNGVVRNVLSFSPKPTKRIVNVGLKVSDAAESKGKFEEAGVPVQSKRNNRFLLKLTPDDSAEHASLIDEAIAAAVEDAGI